MTYNPDIHHRNSIRLQSYDYRSAGAYFVTICTFQKETILAEIAEGEMQLTELGEVVQKCWTEIPQHFPNVELDQFVIMPNHVHAIFIIQESVGARHPAAAAKAALAEMAASPDVETTVNVGAQHAAPGFEMANIERAQHAAPLQNVLPGSLGAIARSFKSACTKRINELRDTPGLPLWQRNYHERVVRNEDDLLALRTYIQNNPTRWEEDPEKQEMDIAENDLEPFRRLIEKIERSGVPFRIHEHRATRTMEDAAQNLSFDVERIVKTVAFRTRSGGIVLAAVRGTRRVDYARLAAIVGVNRRDLSALSPDEVMEQLGIEPGSVSPLPLREDALLLIDEDVLTILPTLYCGIGRPDRTLELAPGNLVRLTNGRVGGFSRKGSE